jgi:hypothetical protein
MSWLRRPTLHSKDAKIRTIPCAAGHKSYTAVWCVKWAPPWAGNTKQCSTSSFNLFFVLCATWDLFNGPKIIPQILVNLFKGIVSRNFEVCFFVSLGRVDIIIPYRVCSLFFKVGFVLNFWLFKPWQEYFSLWVHLGCRCIRSSFCSSQGWICSSVLKESR